MKRDTVVCLFDDSGNLFEDWRAIGYTVVCVDLAPLSTRLQTERVVHVQADLRYPLQIDIDPSRVAMVSAHPPCSDMAISGARWFKGKGLRALAHGIEMFATAAEFCEQIGAPYMIENPVSTISTYWRKPDHNYNPHDYTAHCSDDNYNKKTCLWTGGGFVMPPAERDADLPAPDNRIHTAAPGPLRAYFRSITPRGFGRAVFLSNCPEAAFA